jgi:hypothetical protein
VPIWRRLTFKYLNQSHTTPFISLQKIRIVQLLHHSGSLGRKQNMVLLWNKKKCSLNKRNRKIVIRDDSHARGYVTEISSGIAKDFEVRLTVMSRARLKDITNFAHKEVNTLGKSNSHQTIHTHHSPRTLPFPMAKFHAHAIPNKPRQILFIILRNEKDIFANLQLS